MFELNNCFRDNDDDTDSVSASSPWPSIQHNPIHNVGQRQQAELQLQTSRIYQWRAHPCELCFLSRGDHEMQCVKYQGYLDIVLLPIIEFVQQTDQPSENTIKKSRN